MTKTTILSPRPAKLFEVIYISTIAPHASFSVVGEIAAQSRSNNLAGDISGVLIFDGMRFCQQLEGPQKQVLALLDRIREDDRHTDIQIVHHGLLEQRRFHGFGLAYAGIEDNDVLAQLEQLDGEAAVQAFIALLADIDHDF